MQFHTSTSDTSTVVGETILENVSEFCYLGHTIFNDGKKSTDLRMANAPQNSTSLVMFFVIKISTSLSEKKY